MAAGRLSEMETFVRVVEAQSFTGAARRLGITPSAVSRHVRALEQRLGVRLVNRTTRSLALTEEGRLFFAESQGVLAAVEAAERSVRSAGDALAGTLRVSVPADFARLQLADMLSAFAERHPALSLEVDADTALYALHPHRTLVPAKVRAFVDDLARHCGERPYWDRGL
jgi:DNA-binding transcriptional LysR family regulator